MVFYNVNGRTDSIQSINIHDFHIYFYGIHFSYERNLSLQKSSDGKNYGIFFATRKKASLLYKERRKERLEK